MIDYVSIPPVAEVAVQPFQANRTDSLIHGELNRLQTLYNLIARGKPLECARRIQHHL
jgi:hypothetical protein